MSYRVCVWEDDPDILIFDRIYETLDDLKDADLQVGVVVRAHEYAGELPDAEASDAGSLPTSC